MRFGLLGAGNMGEAILRGAIKGGAIQGNEVTVFDLNAQKLKILQSELGIHTASSMEELMQASDLVLLAIKPNVCAGVFSQYKDTFAQKAVISIIAGWSRMRLAACLPASARILRVMPNTPAMVGEGMVVFENGDTLTDKEHAFAERLFLAIGRINAVDPYLMDAVTSVSGSGPAYVYMFIEALGDAGVREGLPRAMAYELAAQTVLGSARMVLETGLHPGELKDRVCSPAGTTIEAVAALEKGGFRSTVLDAVSACCQKSRDMGK